METLESLENQVDDLKKQLWDLAKNKIPELEAKIENSAGEGEIETPSETPENPETPSTPITSSTWTTLYDMTSEDAGLNLGYTTGIMPNTGVLPLPDLEQYNLLKIYWRTNNNTHNTYILDIGDSRGKTDVVSSYTCLTTNITITKFIALVIGFRYTTDGVKQMYVNAGKDITLNKTSYPTHTSLAGNSAFFITKIQVKV